MKLNNKIHSARVRLKIFFSKLKNTVWFYCHGTGNFIIVKGWIRQNCSIIDNRNLGDELNYYLIQSLSGKRVIAYDSFFHGNRKNYAIIGSVVELCNNKTIIWGSGAFQKEIGALPTKPLKVYAVRGPLTRNYLICNGVECPSVYGDPALLLPLIYKPKQNKHHRIGIIPHFNDLSSPIIDELIRVYQDCVIIKLRNYVEWTEVIDTIANCDAVLSSSLHGLIIADAYKRPNVWVKFSERTFEGEFKYLDYFGGVGRLNKKPIDLNKDNWQEEIENALSKYNTIDFNEKVLLEACPFEIVVNRS